MSCSISWLLEFQHTVIDGDGQSRRSRQGFSSVQCCAWIIPRGNVFNDLPAVPPRIHSTDTQYTVTESSQAVLSCVAEGIPTPTINWRKDNTLLRDTVGKYQTVPGGDLILDNVVVSSLNLSCYWTHLAVIRSTSGLVIVLF